MKKIIGVISFCGFMLSPSVSAMNRSLVHNQNLPNNTSHIRVLNPAAKPFTYLAVHVDPRFEVVNGMSGMMRDIIIRLVPLTKTDGDIRTLMGMCAEHAGWKTHIYFIKYRTSNKHNTLRIYRDNNKKFFYGFTLMKVREKARSLDGNWKAAAIAHKVLSSIGLHCGFIFKIIDTFSSALKTNDFETPLQKAAYKYVYIFCWIELLSRNPFEHTQWGSYSSGKITEILPDMVGRLFPAIYSYGYTAAVELLKDEQIAAILPNEIRVLLPNEANALKETAEKRHVLTNELLRTIPWIESRERGQRKPDMAEQRFLAQKNEFLTAHFTWQNIKNKSEQYWTKQCCLIKQSVRLAKRSGQEEEQWTQQYRLAQQNANSIIPGFGIFSRYGHELGQQHWITRHGTRMNNVGYVLSDIAKRILGLHENFWKQ